ncbi:MAG: adenylate/guanylate cyclase domain-containing protein [Leptolyngbyaceae cyanobacterium RU_5_1]|nr:adenylate/guanylate cyclase domain-containing protein [Leptolyngbyaceae cyanobacterium RU_5_1]
MPVAAPIGTMLLTAAGLQLREQHEKQLLMTLFAKHLDPEMAEMIWQHRGEIAQAGEIYPQELVATVLFMDIRGFTSIAEKLEPRELLNWLNRYLDLMTGCIMEHKGVVDKYIGDGIMAVFGVPFPSTTIERIQQDAINAIAASLSMHQHLQGLNQCFQAEGKPLITIGIGIHTGSVVAGSVGGSQRMNYSVLGDTVNIAARLEAMNKNVLTDNPYNLLVTNETLSYLQDRYRTQLVGDIQLRGRKQRITVFSILGTY